MSSITSYFSSNRATLVATTPVVVADNNNAAEHDHVSDHDMIVDADIYVSDCEATAAATTTLQHLPVIVRADDGIRIG
jgi:hypothetical protein